MVKEIDPRKLEMKTAPEAVLNIDQLIKFGKLEKEAEPIKGFKVMMHVLSQEEREQMGKTITDGEVTTIYSRGEAIKRPTLTWAITKINDEVFETPEQKQVLLNKLKEAPGTTVDLLYLEYQGMYIEQFELIQSGIKKKL
jgi:hypothetical protein